MKKQKIHKISKKDVQKAVANSSKLEGLSLYKAKKNINRI